MCLSQAFGSEIQVGKYYRFTTVAQSSGILSTLVRNFDWIKSRPSNWIENNFIETEGMRLELIQRISMTWGKNAETFSRPNQLFCTDWLPVWPDWAIYWTLGNFLKRLATINLPKPPAFLGIFCKSVKIYLCSSVINFGQLLQTFGNFFLVTLQWLPILRNRTWTRIVVFYFNPSTVNFCFTIALLWKLI